MTAPTRSDFHIRVPVVEALAHCLNERLRVLRKARMLREVGVVQKVRAATRLQVVPPQQRTELLDLYQEQQHSSLATKFLSSLESVNLRLQEVKHDLRGQIIQSGSRLSPPVTR